jgi:hypothetical protein
MAAPHMDGVAVLSLEGLTFIFPAIEVEVLKAATRANIVNILRRRTPNLQFCTPIP